MRQRKRPRSTLPLLPSLMAPPPIQLANHAAMAAEWTDPDDLRPNVRFGRKVSGFRAYCPLRRCRDRQGDRSSFTRACDAAAWRNECTGELCGGQPARLVARVNALVIAAGARGPPFTSGNTRSWLVCQ